MTGLIPTLETPPARSAVPEHLTKAVTTLSKAVQEDPLRPSQLEGVHLLVGRGGLHQPGAAQARRGWECWPARWPT